MKQNASFFLAALLIFLADQLSKYWLIAVYDIPTKTPVHLCEYFALVMTWNKGVSFSMFTSSASWMPWLLIAVALVISGILTRLALRTTLSIERYAYGMIVGGALGNALDRVRFGAVADFFYAHIGDLGWPAFNIADAAICLGVGLLLWGMVKKPVTS